MYDEKIYKIYIRCTDNKNLFIGVYRDCILTNKLVVSQQYKRKTTKLTEKPILFNKGIHIDQLIQLINQGVYVEKFT